MTNQSISQTIKSLYGIQYNLTCACFRHIFGAQSSCHLWKKFNKECNNNLLDFFNHLDNSNKMLLSEYVNKTVSV